MDLRLISAQLRAATPTRSVDPKLYAELVRSLFSTPRSIAGASIVAVAVSAVAYRLSADPVFLGFLLAFLIVGAARSLTVALFARSDREDRPPVRLRRWELAALAGAWSFSGLTGLIAAYATLVHPGTEVELLTSCSAMGYLAGISSRNASRPLVTVGQISAICLPFLVALCYRADIVHLSIALFILCLFTSTVFMSRKIFENIVKRYEAHAELEKAALYDALTGLKNRTTFIRHIDRDLAKRTAGDKLLALIAIDLDNFKDVNDGLGHLAGDAVLKETARRISEAMPVAHEISRIGGDEFLVALHDVELEEARAAAGELCQALTADFRYGETMVRCSASLGLALGPRDGGTYNDLMTSADLALYAAKTRGRRQVIEYCDALRTEFDDRRELEQDMRSALTHAGLELAFQPVIDERSGRAISCEALLRWNHPSRGAVSPSAFIPIAESTGLIVPIGAWVLQEACREAATWPTPISVAVNLSPLQFKRGPELLATVREALAASGLPACRLELEITESVLIENTEATLAIVDELRAEGIGIALDDFGTGFSSLGYLNDFPFTKVKIDRKFCQSACVSARARSIIKSVLQLTSDLGIALVAEGIENSEQLDTVSALGIHAIQGHIFSRPLSASHLRSVLTHPFPVRRARSSTPETVTARSAA
jgi:diguanylate cyclase (GGDEF)-like protein